MTDHRPRRYLKRFYAKLRRQSGRRWLGLALAVLVIVIIILHFVVGANLPGLPASAKPNAATELAATNPGQGTTMSAQINAVIQAEPDMDIGVAIEDLNSGQLYQYGLDNPFVAASVGKLLTATLFLHEVESGRQTMDRKLSHGTAGYELQQMIEQSNNTAWEDLNTLLTHNALSAYAAQIGLTKYDSDDNTLTPSDIAILLGKLYKGKLLNPADTKLLLSYMHDANFDSYIPASIPAGVKVYHKAGWLNDRINDSAIIDNGKRPYVLVIFSKMDHDDSYNANEGHRVFAAITDATVQAFIK